MNYDVETIPVLLAHGAEVDLPNVFQITPLMAAAGMTGTGRPEGPQTPDVQIRAIKTIDLLSAAGANINARVTDSHTHTAKLVSYVQGVDHEGQTALFAATTKGWAQVVDHLLATGADATIKDAAGKVASGYPPPAKK